MKFPQLKSRGWLAVGAALCALSLAGCGGGGGGSSSGPVAPNPTAVPTGGVNVNVQLRDSAGAPVDGLVTLDGQRRATTGGSAAFSNVRRGAQSASAEVNGVVTTKNFVATSGANVVQIAINPNTPTPGGTPLPTPPF